MTQRLQALKGSLPHLSWRIAVVLLLALSAIPIWRALTSPGKETSAGVRAAPAQPDPIVPVARVTREDLYNEVTIPAEFRPYDEVELHAKVSGYVSQMNVDFGDRVKTGQLLATLEVPELHDELHHALAAQKRAEADYKDAHAVYLRLQAVIKDHPNLVAQQDLDAAEAKDGIAEAAIAAAKADVEKYQTLVSYTQITAPFDGVVTHRYVDKGALIQAGTTSETQSLPLVRVSDNYRLRLDFPVSVLYVKDIHVGDKVEVRVESLGDKSLTGTIARSTLRVNEDTRTMTTEIEVPNPKLELVPGMYAKVVLKVQPHPQALTIPIDAVPPGQSSSVYVVNQQNEIEERPVTLGLETPGKCQVITGLREGEMVLIGSRSRVRVGQRVEARLRGSLAQR
jgi:RND family efflux transporter MFP subunit